MRIKLIFSDWQKNGKSVYNTEDGIALSCGDFHSGSTFDGKIVVDTEQERELDKALKTGYRPVFWVMNGKQNG